MLHFDESDEDSDGRFRRTPSDESVHTKLVKAQNSRLTMSRGRMLVLVLLIRLHSHLSIRNLLSSSMSDVSVLISRTVLIAVVVVVGAGRS